MIIRVLTLLITFVGLAIPITAFTKEDQVKSCIEQWVTRYPETQYADLYKNFFQDRFGPGHLLNDTTRAGLYLRKELATLTQYPRPLFEPTGADSTFYRVSLDVIVSGQVSYNDYFDAFIESMNGYCPPSGDEWKREWAAIDSLVSSMGLIFPNELSDREIVRKALETDDFAVHHSDRFNAVYHPAYRIIRADIFKSRLLPLIVK